jgi:hypothetical protein
MADKILKCSKDGWCEAMASRIEPEDNARRKGLSPVVVTNFRTFETRVVGIAFKSSPADRGLLLNVCPWCKQSILWTQDAAEEPAAKEVYEQDGN